MSSAFDGDRQLPLMTGTVAGNPPRNDLAAIGYEPPDHPFIFVIDRVDLVLAEATDLSPPVVDTEGAFSLRSRRSIRSRPSHLSPRKPKHIQNYCRNPPPAPEKDWEIPFRTGDLRHLCRLHPNHSPLTRNCDDTALDTAFLTNLHRLSSVCGWLASGGELEASSFSGAAIRSLVSSLAGAFGVTAGRSLSGSDSTVRYLSTCSFSL